MSLSPWISRGLGRLIEPCEGRLPSLCPHDGVAPGELLGCTGTLGERAKRQPPRCFPPWRLRDRLQKRALASRAGGWRLLSSVTAFSQCHTALPKHGRSCTNLTRCSEFKHHYLSMEHCAKCVATTALEHGSFAVCVCDAAACQEVSN